MELPGFLKPHVEDGWVGWTPYNLCAALHKIVGMTRARSGRGLSEELCNAGWQLGTAATKLASDLDCRQPGNLLLDLRLLGH